MEATNRLSYLVPIRVWKDMARMSPLYTGAVDQDIDIVSILQDFGD